MKSLIPAVMGFGLCLVVDACSSSMVVSPSKTDAAADAGGQRDSATPDVGPDLRTADERSVADLRATDEPDVADLSVGSDASGKDGADASADSPSTDSADSADALEADLPPAGCAGSFSGGNISSDLTFTKACSPYVIQTWVTIGTGHTLVIEAGTTVLFARGAYISVGDGRLDIRGTQSDPVLLDAYAANPSPGSWHGLEFSGTPQSPSQIRYATIRNCAWPAADAGCVWTNTSTAKLLTLDHVTISDSAGNGFVAAGGYYSPQPPSGFSLTNCTFRNIAKDAFAVRVHAQEFTGIGSGNDFGGSPVAIDGGEISVDTAWTSPGTDTQVTGSIDIPGTGSGAPVTFSLGAGIRLLFNPFTGIYMGGSNRLEARGTADAPVVFSSAAPSPKPGDWSGIDVSVSAGQGGINLSHAVIEYGGGGARSGGIILENWFYEAAITDSVIRKNAGHGIYLSCYGQTLPVLTGTKFEANASDLNQTGSIADNVGPGPSGTQACPSP